MHTCMYIHECCALVNTELQFLREEDKYLARAFFHCVSCNYLKSPTPGGPSHLLLLAKDNIFGPPRLVHGSP